MPVDRCLLLDQWAVQQAYDVQQAVVAAYARYDFPEIVQRVQNFCTNELGALYLDITKDRLYTMPTDSHGRRSAQSAMYRIAEAMVRWLAPIAELHGRGNLAGDAGRARRSVLFETWYDGLAATQGSPEQRRFWADLLAIREVRVKQLEVMRASRADRCVAGSRGHAVCRCGDFAASSSRYADELRFFFITSELTLDDDGARAGRCGAGRAASEDGRSRGCRCARATTPKCMRCWHYRAGCGRRIRRIRRSVGAACIATWKGRARTAAGSDFNARHPAKAGMRVLLPRKAGFRLRGIEARRQTHAAEPNPTHCLG